MLANGYNTIASASAVLFGLVLVAITFGYSAALSKTENLLEFKHFVDWLWRAGLACVIYFSFSFLVSMHVLEDEYSYSHLVTVVAITTAVILTLHVQETRRLSVVCREDWPLFRRIFWSQTGFVTVMFAVVMVLTWRATLMGTNAQRYAQLYMALRYLLLLASIRAVFLVTHSFYVLMFLDSLVKREECRYCRKSVHPGAFVCPFCGSDLKQTINSEPY